MLQYKMYPAGELRCPTTALVLFVIEKRLDISYELSRLNFCGKKNTL